jgi:hypothetical protein
MRRRAGVGHPAAPDQAPRRRPLRRTIVAGGLLLVAWGALAGVLLVLTAFDLRAAKAATDRARSMSGFYDVAEGRPIVELRLARRRFERAHDRTGNPVLAPVPFLPVVGRQFRSVVALSGAAARVAGIGEEAMAEGQELLRRPSGSSAERARLVTDLGALAERTRARLQPIPLGPRQGLLPPLASARNTLADELAKAEDGLERGATGAKSVALTLTGPRRYLLFAANNSEMRAGSGMFLSVGELEIDSAGIHLGEMRSVTDVDVPPGSVPIAGDLAAQWGWLEPNREWRNLMTSPRFDAAAPLAAAMWTAAGNRAVDGVIAVDPVTLAGMLEVTGPVTIEGRQITKEGAIEELLHGQYLRYTTEERSERQEGLAQLARSAFDALDSGGWSVPGLASALTSSAGGRHLMLWSRNAEAQAGWRALRVDGSLPPDSLLLSVVNRAANKLDWFLHVSAGMTFVRAGDSTDVAIEITLENGVPAGEPPYVLGSDPGSGVAPGTYLGILTLNLPGWATDARFDGVDHLAVSGADGDTRVVGFQLQLDPGAAKTVVARFRLPGHDGTLRVEPSARVPSTKWRLSGREWTDEFSRSLFWNAL